MKNKNLKPGSLVIINHTETTVGLVVDIKKKGEIKASPLDEIRYDRYKTPYVRQHLNRWSNTIQANMIEAKVIIPDRDYMDRHFQWLFSENRYGYDNDPIPEYAWINLLYLTPLDD